MADEPEPADRFQFRLWHLFLAVTAVAALLAVVVPLIGFVREAEANAECSNRLKQIGIALHNYHDVFQSFPAAYQVDGSGKVAHSWRVAIWPFLGIDRQADDYLYSEPWNGLKNSKLQSTPTSTVFRSPRELSGPPGMTNFVAVVGPDTAWPGKSYASLSSLKDETANTIMVVEITNSDILWMEPRDLPIEELEQWLDPSHKPTLLAGSKHRGVRGGLVMYADGHTEFLPHDTTIKRLRALLSPAGNDHADAIESEE